MKFGMRNSWAPPRARGSGPRCGRRSLGLRGATPTLIHVIQHNINQDICRVIKAGTLDRKGPQLVGELVPAEKLPKVNVAHFKGLDVFENIQWHGRVKGKLLVTSD